jgi:hypothetical protein
MSAIITKRTGTARNMWRQRSAVRRATSPSSARSRLRARSRCGSRVSPRPGLRWPWPVAPRRNRRSRYVSFGQVCSRTSSGRPGSGACRSSGVTAIGSGRPRQAEAALGRHRSLAQTNHARPIRRLGHRSKVSPAPSRRARRSPRHHRGQRRRRVPATGHPQAPRLTARADAETIADRRAAGTATTRATAETDAGTATATATGRGGVATDDSA